MSELLAIDDVCAGYGEAVVIEKVSLKLAEGESVALLGRNGVGKSTLLMTLMGLTRQHSGFIRWRGADVTTSPAHQRAHGGLGWVPQERFVFPSLTVEENLTVVAKRGPWSLDRVYEVFPRLRERRGNLGNQLSGGEQQMLAIARALMINPKLLLLDEPMEGLAPLIVKELMAAVRTLVADGMAVIIVEQHAKIALAIATRAIVLERGRVVHESSSQSLLEDVETLTRLTSVS